MTDKNDPQPRVSILEMTPERKLRMHRAASQINEILESQVPDVTEAFGVLDLVWSAWEKAHNVVCAGAKTAGSPDA